ncbi:MAG: CU044_2847 family protein [Frankiaceae bacterium]
MKRLIEFSMDERSGSTIVIETDEPEAPGITRAARPGEVAERARETFEQAVARVAPAAEAVVQQLRSSVSTPDEITVGFGISFSAAAGAFIAKAGLESTFNVTVSWRSKHDEQSPRAGA